MRRLSLILAAVVAALALTPATGEAAKLKYHSCSGTKYLLLNPDVSPLVKLLRIKMRHAKADDYAPRCLVAEGGRLRGLAQGDRRQASEDTST